MSHPLPGHPFTFPRALLLASLIVAVPALGAEPDPAPTSGWVAVSATVLTLLFAVWSAVVWWLRSAILGRLKLLALEKTRQISSQRLRRLSLRRLLQLAAIGTRLASIALILGAAFVWITALLDQLPVTHEFARQIERHVLLEFQTLLLSAARAVPGLGIVALIYFATRVLHELFNHYFRSIAEGEITSTLFDPVTAETTRRLADVGIWIAALIIAFPYIPGSESPAFRGVTVLAGLMLSLGSTNLVGQFASGLALIYGRSIRPGEYVQVDGHEGTVEHIGLFACTLRTPREEIVVLPHTAITGGIKSLSRHADRVRLTTTVTIGYDTPWRQVRDLLLAAAAATPGLRTEPPPEVRQTALQDFYVSYELLFTPEQPEERSFLLAQLHAAIQDEFHRASVQIMSPHYRSDPATPKIPPGRPGA